MFRCASLSLQCKQYCDDSEHLLLTSANIWAKLVHVKSGTDILSIIVVVLKMLELYIVYF